MKKNRYSEEQIIRILREADREPVAEVSKRHTRVYLIKPLLPAYYMNMQPDIQGFLINNIIFYLTHKKGKFRLEISHFTIKNKIE